MYKELVRRVTAILLLLAGFNFIAEAQTCSSAPVGLVSWWSGDGNALDSRSRNNGTLNGNAFAAGHVGQTFDLSNETGITVADDSSFNRQSFTIEAWVTAQPFDCPVSCAQFIVAKSGLGDTTGYELGTIRQSTPGQTGGALRFTINSATGGADLIDDVSIADGSFHHVAASYDGTTMKIYLDGVLSAQKIDAETVNYEANGLFVIGARQFAGSTFPYNGLIDEVGFYERALADSEIAAIHAAGTAGKCKPTATVAPDNLAGWWSGDSNANDRAGTNNGTPQNGASFAVGRIGQSFRFDGIDDFVSVANDGSLDFGTGDFSIELWVNLISLATDQTLFHKISGTGSSSNDPSYLLEYNQPNSLRFRIGSDLTNRNDLIVPTSLTAGQWFHVAAVRNGNTNDLFLNGVLIGSQTAGSGLNTGTGGTTVIGKCQTSSGCIRFVNGQIDELSLYNRTLTQDEITSIFNAGIAGKLKQTTTPTGLVLSVPPAVAGGLMQPTQDIVRIGVASNESNVLIDKSQPPVTAGGTDLAPEAVNTTVGDSTITFPTVTSAGTTQQIPLDTSLFPALTAGTHTGLAYDIATSAAFTGNPSVCFNVPSFTTTQFANLRAMHFENGSWVNVTTSSNTFPTLCTDPVTSFSPFSIAVVGPSAANVSVGGRVLTADGRFVPHATIVFTDTSGNAITTISSSFGYYRLEGLGAGSTYFVTTNRKGYQFDPLMITPTDDIADFDITASGSLPYSLPFGDSNRVVLSQHDGAVFLRSRPLLQEIPILRKGLWSGFLFLQGFP